ncbi:MAG: hypothetical protein H0T46_25165 [Deltaproteobacteria bacterium]|nr:hypothetical protein [Deltaproteobacteria bacterium]
MSARSSLRSALALLLVTACGGKTSGLDADPAQVAALATTMIQNTPAPAALPACTTAQLAAPSLTARTLIQLAGQEIPDRHERTDWINPSELDEPAARTLVDPAATAEAKRAAAGTLLGKSKFIVWRPETVDVPLAVGSKELRRGIVGFRALGYDRAGNGTCITVFTIKNDKAVSEWAMDKSDKAEVDPAISKALQQDLKKVLIGTVASLRAGQAP